MGKSSQCGRALPLPLDSCAVQAVLTVEVVDSVEQERDPIEPGGTTRKGGGLALEVVDDAPELFVLAPPQLPL